MSKNKGVPKKKKKSDTLDEDEQTTPKNAGSLKRTKKKSVKKKEGSTKKSSNNENKSKKGLGNTKCDPQLVVAMKKFEDALRTMNEKSLCKYFDTKLANYKPDQTKATAFENNKMLNRNKDIPVYDHNRVKLEGKDDSSNYINASLVTFEDFERKYIITQYPLLNTIEDFWTMVFSNDVDTILSIFNPQGDGDLAEMSNKKPPPAAISCIGAVTTQTLSAETLPSAEKTFDISKSQRGREIATASSRCTLSDSTSFFPLFEGQYVTVGRFFVHTRKFELHDKTGNPDIYTIELLPEGCSECKFVRIVNFPRWDSRNLPINPKSILAMIRSASLDPLQKGPVVIHCDTGTNRSATVVLADVISNKVLAGKTVDVGVIEDLFKQLRSQRAQAIQSGQFFSYALYTAATYVFLRAKVRQLVPPDVLSSFKSMLKEIGRPFQTKSAEESTAF